jgi:uncharacterized protein YcfL
MRIKPGSIILSLAALLMVGCATPNLINSNKKSNGICVSEPEWVLKPPAKKGKIYGVGIAPPNFNGKAAQRKSAISKAVSEIASQLNTIVNSQTIASSVLYNKSAKHSMSSVSFQTVNGQKVSSKIIKSCENPNNNYLYILMETDEGSK